jgi:hypothetical protein
LLFRFTDADIFQGFPLCFVKEIDLYNSWKMLARHFASFWLCHRLRWNAKRVFWLCSERRETRVLCQPVRSVVVRRARVARA